MTQTRDLFSLRNKQLVSASLDLVDKSLTKELIDCFDNIFKESIMKYLLKTVIEQEIQEISKPNIDDWKRISLITKIKKLIPNSSEQSITIHSPHSVLNDVPVLSSDLKAEISTCNKLSVPPMDKNETSTDHLLLSGYIRNEMNFENNNYFPKDVLSICHCFISDCSNINNDQQLIVFNHNTNTYKSVFDTEQKLMPTIISETQLKSKLECSDVNARLISPYKIWFYDDKKAWICDTFPHYPEAKDVNANMQQIGNFECDSQAIHKGSISGVVQYVDIHNSSLLNFGGIGEDTTFIDLHSIYMTSDLYTPHNNVRKLSLKDTLFPLKKIEQKETQIQLPKLQSAPIFRASDDNVAQNQFSAPMVGDDYSNKPSKHTIVLTLTGSPQHTLSPLQNYQPPTQLYWKYSKPLIYARGYVSLCEITDSKLAVIGGKTWKRETQSYGRGPNIESMVDCVELYDLNGKDSVPIKNLNHARMECGSYYNSYQKEIIVFGGSGRFDNDSSVSNSMEIYDFHKNIWIDVPYYTRGKYKKYPCIWTVGSKCIFVAQITAATFIECEWIDFRVCDKNGKNKSKWNYSSQFVDTPCTKRTVFMQQRK
eukprot:333180_1